jgi:hypothetical protein
MTAGRACRSARRLVILSRQAKHLRAAILCAYSNAFAPNRCAQMHQFVQQKGKRKSVYERRSESVYEMGSSLVGEAF